MNVRMKKAIAAINKHGILLTYPINNRPEPRSIWSELHPRTSMRWEWDDEGDDKVAEMWHMRTELMATKEVVYAKWYQGRATFFSREVFTELLAAYGTPRSRILPSRESKQLLEILEMDSPLSTKELKKASGLQGKFLESNFQKAMKVLWTRLEIVGVGEVDDGAFPSLAVGATRLIHEDLWEASKELRGDSVRANLAALLESAPKFLRFLEKTLAGVSAPDLSRDL